MRKLIKEKFKKLRMFRLSELKELVKKNEVTLHRKEQLIILKFLNDKDKEKVRESISLVNFGRKGYV